MTTSIAVLDVGKTRSKLSLWAGGRLVRQTDRANTSTVQGGLAQLDIVGVQDWLLASLADFAAGAAIDAIVPTGHGAAAVLVDGDDAVAALDYEAPIPPEAVAAYEGQRDPFEATLSPRLPNGLNLGVQLFWLEQLFPDLWPRRGRVLLWPQYWARVLCGEAACEVTSLGCHSDLWRPFEGRFSDLALRRGWAERLGPLRRAAEPLGEVRPAIAQATGLPAGCLVYCGLHDSNAALHAARRLTELGDRPFSVVSTGTWFICLNADGAARVDYDPREDMLANVDVEGRAVPTSRFMGGRDYEDWMGASLGASSSSSLLSEAADLDRWTDAPPGLRATRASLELARRTDRALRLVSAEGPILMEGRFADDRAYATALAQLRPTQPVYRSTIADGVAMGAARLVARTDLARPPLVAAGA